MSSVQIITAPASVTTTEREVVRVQINHVGAQGPRGLSGSEAYVHTQSSPVSTWTINHNLGHKPSVAVFSAGGLEVSAQVVHTNDNQTVISFSAPFSGSARLQ